ncbi:hypothetical protein EUV02_03815 [Polymorphobacter arshaanensis]|uniref:Uncharacterized protein n=1 Tax=Glacieibacterium arshaanense TaxID=2511025 RepID=A0A4Y9ESG7_9SPHN|nr:hypothetical protein [Polymorphobacter arshaanensis]TFU06149.1 hypothetical protein EUV02_03815 [Polymorphobacter arshaanensis]
MLSILNLLTPKVGGALLAALVVMMAFAGIQTARLHNTADKLELSRTATDTLEMRVKADGITIKGFKDAIATQNLAIDKMSAQRTAERIEYQAGLKAAEKVAARAEVKASNLMALQAPADTDEIVQCRAARDLLIQELTHE